MVVDIGGGTNARPVPIWHVYSRSVRVGGDRWTSTPP
jgi:actin-like ATPase involved in cell morphogenesis